ncbi:MAG: hypothetical protein OHK0053_08320 [Microscillaceae bacterium]
MVIAQTVWGQIELPDQNPFVSIQEKAALNWLEKAFLSPKPGKDIMSTAQIQKIQHWADETENPRLQFWARYLPARNAYLQDLFDELTYYEALFLAQQHQLQPELALAQTLLAELFQGKEIFDQALEYAQEALPVLQRYRQNREIALALYIIGTSLYHYQKYTLSNQYLIRLQKNPSFKTLLVRVQINACNTLGLSSAKTQNLPQAFDFFEQAHALAVQHQDSVWMGIIRGNQAQLFAQTGQVEKAQQFFAQDIALSVKHKEWQNAIESLLQSGTLYLKQKNTFLAQKQFTQARTYLKNVAVSAQYELARRIYQQLAEVHWQRNQFREAKIYADSLAWAYENFQTIQDTLVRQQKALISEGFLVQMRNLYLQKQNQQQNIRLQKAQSEARLWQIGLALLIILLFSVGIILYQRRRGLQSVKRQSIIIQAKNNQIDTQNQNIQRQNEELIAQNEELKSQQDEIMQQREFIEVRNHDLEVLNRQLLRNEGVLRKAVDKLRQKEEIIQQQNEMLKRYNANLEQEVESRLQEIIHKNETLLHYNHQLEQFAFVTAHNLRAPIARLLGLLNLLDLEMVSVQEQALYLSKLRLVGQELDTIVKDLNTLLEVRKSPPYQKEWVVFDELLQRQKAALQGFIAQVDARLEVDFEVDKVLSFPTYWENIFFQLLSNALKYRNPHHPLLIRLSTSQKGPRLYFSICDNGLGIDLAQHRDKIFGLYKRFHPQIEGKGLGLHLVKLQTEAMQGEVWVESTEGRGTTFTISIPI